MRPAILRSERLLLRPIRAADIARFFEHARAPEVHEPLGIPCPRTFRETERYVRGALRQWDRRTPKERLFSILLKGSRWIGVLRLGTVRPGTLELGYSLHPRQWGKGYATEASEKAVGWAFAALGAHRIEAHCWTENPGSEAVLERLGMRREGTMRAFRQWQGVSRNYHLYAVTREDWNRRTIAWVKRHLQ